MFYRIGRMLQVAGMILLPIGMAGNILRPEVISVQESLVCGGVGVVVFMAGWLVQQLGRPR
jgi:hypothetical protein